MIDQKRNERLWKACGFKFENRIWTTPDGETYPDGVMPPQPDDLNALFQWAVPKIAEQREMAVMQVLLSVPKREGNSSARIGFNVAFADTPAEALSSTSVSSRSSGLGRDKLAALAAMQLTTPDPLGAP